MSNIQRFRIAAIALVLTATIAAAHISSAQESQAAGEQQSLTGTVRCAAQASGHYTCRRNQTAMSCALDCAAQGSGFVLQTASGTYSLTGDESVLEKLAGGRAELTGRMIGSTFAVNTGSGRPVNTTALLGK
jgi:hypothetical protein